jgi:prevent-host-death family protein
MIMTMIVINIHEAKAKLSEYLEAAAGGETVVICKRNRPIAELRAVEQKRREPRPIGAGLHTFEVPDSFFEPMPEEWLSQFYDGPIFPETPAQTPSRVAEKRPDYRAPASRRRKR